MKFCEFVKCSIHLYILLEERSVNQKGQSEQNAYNYYYTSDQMMKDPYGPYLTSTCLRVYRKAHIHFFL